jgi:quercetin dioxygenase-like cupin family protein
MSSKWRPDDSLLEKEGGELRGARRAKDALKKHGVETEGRIITSRDKGMDRVHAELKRGDMPDGVEQRQVPVALGRGADVLAFVTEVAPNAEIPEHDHRGAEIFRLILKGSLRTGNTELHAGDWMLVPAGKAYGLKAGDVGCTIWHWYFPWPF